MEISKLGADHDEGPTIVSASAAARLAVLFKHSGPRSFRCIARVNAVVNEQQGSSGNVSLLGRSSVLCSSSLLRALGTCTGSSVLVSDITTGRHAVAILCYSSTETGTSPSSTVQHSPQPSVSETVTLSSLLAFNLGISFALEPFLHTNLKDSPALDPTSLENQSRWGNLATVQLQVLAESPAFTLPDLSRHETFSVQAAGFSKHAHHRALPSTLLSLETAGSVEISFIALTNNSVLSVGLGSEHGAGVYASASSARDNQSAPDPENPEDPSSAPQRKSSAAADHSGDEKQLYDNLADSILSFFKMSSR